jgi:hypothetical protein
MMAKDPNASISVISGAWAIPLFQSNRNFQDIRRDAAILQKKEAEFLKALRSQWARSRVRIWTLAEFIEAPMEQLQLIVDDIGQYPQNRLTTAPKMVDLTGFGQFVQNLKNQGMHPYLLGDFPADPAPPSTQSPPRRPYLVQ